jgi:rhodanese-related sulfurtransferase
MSCKCNFNIPIGSLSNRIDELDKYKDEDIVVICRSGARAAAGARILRKAGLKNVFVLKGGMINWEKTKKRCKKSSAIFNPIDIGKKVE